MARLGPRGDRLLQAVILTMAGAVASLGMTFGCLIRNLILSPGAFAHNFAAPSSSDPNELHGHLSGTGIGDMAGTVLLAILMLVWFWAVVRFVRREPKSMLTWVLALPILTVFIWTSWQTWLLAYPVCNAM